MYVMSVDLLIRDIVNDFNGNWLLYYGLLKKIHLLFCIMGNSELANIQYIRFTK